MRLQATQVMITPETTIRARLATLFSYMAFMVFESSFRPMSEGGFLLENLLTQVGLLYRGQKNNKIRQAAALLLRFYGEPGDASQGDDDLPSILQHKLVVSFNTLTRQL